MRAIIDADIFRYEIGFAAEVAWRGMTGEEEALPPFDFVREILHERIAYILAATECDSYTLYLTASEPTFRFEIATVKPYKGTRPSNKPWHFDNLTVHMVDVLGAKVIKGIEADDAMSIDHLADPDTVLCSRDKDLRQVPGWFYSWELGRQPAFGPVKIEELGWIELKENRKDIKGTGFAFFAAQLLLGDKVDNIPGLPGCGPVAAFEALNGCTSIEEYMEVVRKLYQEHYPDDWIKQLNEQGILCWMLRSLNPDDSIPLWDEGDY